MSRSAGTARKRAKCRVRNGRGSSMCTATRAVRSVARTSAYGSHRVRRARWTSSTSAIHGWPSATNVTPNATALATPKTASQRLGSGRSAPPAVPREERDDEDGRHEAQIRGDVPVRCERHEVWEPAEGVHAEGDVEEILELLLECVVEGARGHRREEERRERAHADENADEDPHPPVASRREPVRDERRRQR